MISDGSTITIEASVFHKNSATFGGVLISDSSTIAIEASEFHDNNAIIIQGGVVHSLESNITVEASRFHNNNGGVLLGSDYSIITIGDSNFTNNDSPFGAVIYATSRTKIQHQYTYLLIDGNMAYGNAVMYLSDSEFVGYDTENELTFSNNLGSIVAFNSNITFTGYAGFVNNQPLQMLLVLDDFQEGGAISLFQSNVYFNGVCNLEHNHAENGGAILSTESKLYVNGNVTIAHNTAARNGGGVYLSTSELNCQQKCNFVLWNNTAAHKGGGLHAISSSVKATSSTARYGYTQSGARMVFLGNAAERGGGLSLEASAKLYVLKYDNGDDIDDANTTIFTANSADYGGAVYVDDDSNSGTCASNTKIECCLLSTNSSLSITAQISRHKACISQRTLLTFLVPLSMEDY